MTRNGTPAGPLARRRGVFVGADLSLDPRIRNGFQSGPIDG